MPWIDRRGFLKRGGAAFGFAALGPRGLFAAAPGAFAAGRPNLVLGILSDIHVQLAGAAGEPETFYADGVLRKALEWFRDQGADAVAICGDLADSGLVAELDRVAQTWFSVFPDGKAPDGRSVEKLFVGGNHDWEGFLYGGYAKRRYGDGFMEHTVRSDFAGAWRKAFREEYSPVWCKMVKGYGFAGAHWTGDGYHGAAGWIAANAGSFDPSKPFFYLQHPPPKDTCHGPFVWGRDDGSTAVALSRFPNAIALSGHSHASIGDERAIWQGAFTSIGAGSLRYTGLHYHDLRPAYRENDAIGGSAAEVAARLLRRMETGDGHQGILARVFDDRIVFERRDIADMGSIGPDWVMPLPAPGNKPFAFASRAASCPAPEFPDGAALSVRVAEAKNRGGRGVEQKSQKALEVTIPAANRNGSGRVFDYAIEIAGADGKAETRYMFAEGFHRSRESKRANSPSVFLVSAAGLAAKGDLKISVWPRNSFGRRGVPLAAVFGGLR